MIETERSEFRTIRQAFGGAAYLVETGPAPGRPGRCEIRLGSGMIGSGSTFRVALCDAMQFTMPGIVKASDLLPAERSGVRATAEPSSTSIALRGE